MYTEDISRCTSTPCYSNNKSNDRNYENSLFSLSNVFDDLHNKANRCVQLIVAELLYLTSVNLYTVILALLHSRSLWIRYCYLITL